ncbi:MAG: hypothetical protein AAF649_07875 [Verrucomicrobiota bacterium]
MPEVLKLLDGGTRDVMPGNTNQKKAGRLTSSTVCVYRPAGAMPVLIYVLIPSLLT